VKTAPTAPVAKKPSYWIAIGLHWVFGLGLFYVDRRLKRKWLYPIACFSVLIGIVYPNDTTIILLALLAALIYLFGFIDVILTCRARRKPPLRP